MKVEQPKVFNPVTIVLTSEEEFIAFRRVLQDVVSVKCELPHSEFARELLCEIETLASE